MCKYLNRTLMTCRFNYSQLVDGSLISPHEGPGPRVLPTGRTFLWHRSFWRPCRDNFKVCNRSWRRPGWWIIKSTLPGMWSMVKFVWNCLESLLWRIWISLPLPPKNTFSCVASDGNRFEMVPNVFASFGATCWFCKFAQCSRLLSVAAGECEDCLFAGDPYYFCHFWGRAPLFFCGKTVRQLDCSIFCLQDQINSKLSQGLPREAGARE